MILSSLQSINALKILKPLKPFFKPMLKFKALVEISSLFNVVALVGMSHLCLLCGGESRYIALWLPPCDQMRENLTNWAFEMLEISGISGLRMRLAQRTCSLH